MFLSTLIICTYLCTVIAIDMFSKACEYGIKSMIYLASHSAKNEVSSLEEISKGINSPEAFTSKVLQHLVKSKLVVSIKGAKGGFKIEKEFLPTINLSTIVNAIDGDKLLVSCGLGLSHCNEKKPCPIHNQYASIRTDLNQMLESTFLVNFSDQSEANKYVLK